MTDLTRRQYIGGVAALAATRWENEDYDIENVENQDSLAHSEVITGEISPKDVTTSADGKYGGVMFSDDDFTERVAQVRYWSDGVSLDIEAKGGGKCSFWSAGQFDNRSSTRTGGDTVSGCRRTRPAQRGV
jgi:hypothetical protein